MDLRPLLHERLVVRQALGRPRIILDRDGVSPYLSRFYLRGKPTMPDGSEPFDSFGNPFPEARFPDGISTMVHRFHASDAPGALHNHPWRWSGSLVLAGGYREQRRDFTQPYGIAERDVLPGQFNYIRGSDYHRVELLDDECWTIFMTGPKNDGWGFWDPATGRTTPWRQYLKEQRMKAVA